MLRSTLLVLVAAVPVCGQQPPELERAMVRAAPDLVQHFQAKGYANVGVLKFVVSKDGKTLSDNVGTLNMTLANRLEIALVVANDAAKPVGVVRGASAV